MALLCIFASLVGSFGGLALCWIGVTLADLIVFLFGGRDTFHAPPERKSAFLRPVALSPALIDRVYCRSVLAGAKLVPEIPPYALREMLGPLDESGEVRFDAEGKFSL